MIPAAFEYRRVASAEEAVAALVEYGDDAKLLAGGMSLIPLMKLRLATPSVLVDVGPVRDLSYIRDAGDHVALGALTRHHDLEHSDLLAQHCGVLRAVAGEVGDPRCVIAARSAVPRRTATPRRTSRPRSSRSTRCSSRGPSGERAIDARDFFVGFLETALAPDELLTEIRVPKTGPAGFNYQKFNRRAQDWAIVGALAVRNGATRVALVNMGSTPVRASAVEEALAAGASIADAADRAAEGREPPSDLNATPEFREHLARVLVRRALEAAA